MSLWVDQEASLALETWQLSTQDGGGGGPRARDKSMACGVYMKVDEWQCFVGLLSLCLQVLQYLCLRCPPVGLMLSLTHSILLRPCHMNRGGWSFDVPLSLTNMLVWRVILNPYFEPTSDYLSASCSPQVPDNSCCVTGGASSGAELSFFRLMIRATKPHR